MIDWLIIELAVTNFMLVRCFISELYFLTEPLYSISISVWMPVLWKEKSYKILSLLYENNAQYVFLLISYKCQCMYLYIEWYVSK